MLGHYYLTWIVLLFGPQVFGHDIVEERLLQLEKFVKLQNEALAQQRETLGQQRESQEQQHKEFVLLKAENDLLISKVKNLEQQVNFLMKTPVENTNNLAPPVVESVPTNVTTVPTEPDLDPVAESLDKRRGVGKRLESGVAFYAYRTGGPCLQDLETLVFESEVTDLANSYNPTSGVFTVPATGTYVFTWTAASRSGWYLSELAVNGVIVGHVNVYSSNTAIASQATGIVVITVNQGDSVFVRKELGNGCNLHDSRYHLTSFSGWRLF